ncbi:MAG: hypothetical protein R3F19_01445 [Verrucomicrobiales bacterium]
MIKSKDDFLQYYDALKTFPDGRQRSIKVAATAEAALKYLSERETQELNSAVKGKTYFAFRGSEEKRSRAINKALFLGDSFDSGILNAFLRGERDGLSAGDLNRLLYTAAIGFCAAVDLVKTGDQKTPGTFFEYFCASIFHSVIEVLPVKSLDVLNLDLEAKLPTDFIFDLGNNKPKFHVPVKTSTRERIIQVWAHQRVLEGAYGMGRFLGVPMVLSENKTDSRKLLVSEICLPAQWRLYQLHIASMWKIVYFDLPEPYEKLNRVFPPVSVNTVGNLVCAGGALDELIGRY